jgi:hypothetical protein
MSKQIASVSEISKHRKVLDVITSLVNPTKFYKSKAENKDHVASKFFKS